MKKTVKYSRGYKTYPNSKGNRLGWLLVDEVKDVKLKKLLSEREHVHLDKNNQPLLVP